MIIFSAYVGHSAQHMLSRPLGLVCHRFHDRRPSCRNPSQMHSLQTASSLSSLSHAPFGVPYSLSAPSRPGRRLQLPPASRHARHSCAFVGLLLTASLIPISSHPIPPLAAPRSATPTSKRLGIYFTLKVTLF